MEACRLNCLWSNEQNNGSLMNYLGIQLLLKVEERSK